jgi:hypothetical protein
MKERVSREIQKWTAPVTAYLLDAGQIDQWPFEIIKEKQNDKPTQHRTRERQSP